MGKFLAFRIGLDKDNKIKAAAGILLAAAALFFWQYWFAGSLMATAFSIVLAVAFLAAGFFRCHADTDAAARALNSLWGMLSITAVIFVALPTRNISNIGWNFLCAAIAVGFFLMIAGSWRPAINISVCALTLLIGVNLIVYAFRGKELAIGDLRAGETALSVIDQYSFQMSKRFLCLCSSFALAIFSQFAFPPMPERKGKKYLLRIAAFLSALAAALLMLFGTAKITVLSWGFDGTECNGFLLNFSLSIRDAVVKPPENYTPEQVELYSSAYRADGTQEQNGPNIIVIMNEAYSDLSIYGKALPTNTPVTPFIDSLSENTVKGYALTSIYGGKTSNSEFEFLTGHTMAFLPTGSVPYQQYYYEEKCSLPWMLESYGYEPVGTHPFRADGWSRSTVYPLLGLRESTFLEDYPQEDLVRGYVSDQEMFEYVLARLEESKGDQPLFLMGITMQNHGGYLYDEDDFTETVHLTGLSREYPDVDQYLSLLNRTDRAVEYLLSQLQDYPEDTIVVFFGDHLPNLGMEIVEELHGGALDSLDEKMFQYTVPFFIWANYDIEEAVIPQTSLNYLPLLLLETAGLELPTYYRILSDIRETVPAINAFGYYSPEKGRYATLSEAEGKEAEMLEMYQHIQYNNLFDTENRNYELFGQYLSP